MDIQECCRRAEECLTLAKLAKDQDERLYWYCKAGQWIDRGEAAAARSEARREQSTHSSQAVARP